MKVLIPIDVWQGNDSLVQDLSIMLPLAECDLLLIYSIQSEPHIEKAAGREDIDTLYVQMEKKAKSSLEQFAIQLKPLCKSIDTCFEHGSAASVIESLAKRKNADIIVIRGSATGLLESTIAENTITAVVKHSPCSVLVLRSGAITEALNKVIIGLDGSQSAKDALRKFCQLYKSLQKKIEVELVHVVSIPGPWRFIAPVEFIATLEDNLDMAAKAILAEGKAIMTECGWQTNKKADDMIIRSGEPAFELDRLANEINARLIVVSAQGKTAVQHFLLGSVSEALSLKSSSPVFVFR